MTNEEISNFATRLTYNGVTIVFKVDKPSIVGFFNNNTKQANKTSSEFINNLWNFKQTETQKDIVLNGDEIASITIN